MPARLKSDSSGETTDTKGFQAGLLLTVAAAHALHDTYASFLSPLLPLLITVLSLSKAEAGLLSVLHNLPSVIQPLIGYTADRINLRPLFFLTPAITAATMSCLTATSSYGLLGLLLVVSGISAACFHPVALAYAGNLSGRRLGRGMSFWIVGGTLGFTLGPLLVVTVLRHLGPQRLPWVMVGGLLGSAVLYLTLRDVSLRPAVVRQAAPWREALRCMGPIMIPLAGIIVVRSFVSAALRTYLPTFLSEEGADLWFAGLSLSVYQGAGIVGALLGGSLSDTLGRRRLLVASLLATPVLMFVFLAINGWARLLVLLALGPVVVAIVPVNTALVQERFPENRALASGLLMSMSFVLNSLIVVVVGAIGDRIGMRGAFATSAIIPLLGLPLVFFLPKERLN